LKLKQKILLWVVEGKESCWSHGVAMSERTHSRPAQIRAA